MKVRHFGFPVNNIDKKSSEFVKLGFEVIYDRIEDVRVVKLKQGDHIIELLEFQCVHNVAPHVAFTDHDDFYIEEVSDAAQQYRHTNIYGLTEKRRGDSIED